MRQATEISNSEKFVDVIANHEDFKPNTSNPCLALPQSTLSSNASGQDNGDQENCLPLLQQNNFSQSQQTNVSQLEPTQISLPDSVQLIYNNSQSQNRISYVRSTSTPQHPTSGKFS